MAMKTTDSMMRAVTYPSPTLRSVASRAKQAHARHPYCT